MRVSYIRLLPQARKNKNNIILVNLIFISTISIVFNIKICYFLVAQPIIY